MAINSLYMNVFYVSLLFRMFAGSAETSRVGNDIQQHATEDRCPFQRSRAPAASGSHPKRLADHRVNQAVIGDTEATRGNTY